LGKFINNEQSSVGLTDEDLVKSIGHLVEKARKPYWLKRPTEWDDRYVLVGPDGVIKDIDASVPPRRYNAESLIVFIDMVKNTARMYAEEGVCIFCGFRQLTAVIDEDQERADRIYMKLDTLESYSWLTNRCNVPFTQPELIWDLRSLFANHVVPPAFPVMIQKIKFQDRKSGQISILHGNETIDLQVQKELVGIDGDLESQIIFETPVLEEHASVAGPLFQVQCAVRTNVQDQTFTIKPIEGELNRARLAAVNIIYETLVDADLGSNVMVYRDSIFG